MNSELEKILSSEQMAAILEATGDYRVLRRLRPGTSQAEAPPGSKRGVLLDVETTGLDPDVDEIIELAMLPFFYSDDDEIVGVGVPFNELRQPTRPIPAEVTKLTGIDQDMVAGKSIDPDSVSRFAGGSLIVAHNAAFDRRFMEKFCPSFARNPWACSMSEVPWKDHGFETNKLAFLAATSGFYYDRHRAVHDCHAAVELLARPLAATGTSALKVLLASARTNSVRCWAENSPFEKKDILKARGYRWNGDNTRQPRGWWIDVTEADLSAEISFLHADIYQREAPIRRSAITAFNRYSDRFFTVS
ncbi:MULTISPECIES: 3'-5' exonuclease [Rhodopseudomonas]|uniref:DNA polymerase III subunit epsilon n=1 Tax=Rhodopseudomonas palustris TaxID=1076 RepID=A0A0D7EPD3_RHOPL|nr:MULTISPECIES: 3'-5' exonuclease [Rhodopseudomonas]KIZ41302.1 DNA polymerase III subunit epsilon [Rhodopseudomonas palustris]MDF3813140.1 3'-5' exonuclease [Rhodopseudomonas sp. BAL398]WOK16731.1 3'-5' exonuclease [Rhodopseudomonas sp. BAL398]